VAEEEVIVLQYLVGYPVDLVVAKEKEQVQLLDQEILLQ
tara:strand:- start:187 stop:303 length:117 start_codon:yes stop_codon:yes gene_type:complete